MGWLVGINGDVKLIYVAELRRFGIGGTSHTGELLIHAEEVLEGDAGERLGFPLDFHAFLRFYGLMQTIAPAPAGHQAAGELIDNDDLAFLDDVIPIPQIEDMGAQRLLHMMVHFDIGGIVKIAGIEQLFDFQDAFFGKGDGSMFLIDSKIAGCIRLAGLFAFDHFAAFENGMIWLTR